MSKSSVEQEPQNRRRQESSGGMMGSSFRILRVRGISIGAHWSWLLVFGLVSYSLATDLSPRPTPI